MDWDYSRHYARLHTDTPEHDANLRELYARWLGPYLPSDKNIPILDVGCGRGYALRWLRDLGYTQLSGIDLDSQQAAFAQGQGLAVQQVDDSVGWLTARPRAFGLVLLMDVLEHQPRGEDRRLLEAIHNALRPGGQLLCTMPNAMSPLANHWRYADYTHHTTFTIESLDYLLGHAGFRLTGARSQEFIARPRFFFWPPDRRTLRWWMLCASRLQPRLASLGEFGWREGWRTPLGPTLVAQAVRD
jgi:SAM-dependent methyltransferase